MIASNETVANITVIAITEDSNLVETTIMMIARMTNMMTNIMTVATIAPITTLRYICLQIGFAISTCDIQNIIHHHQMSSMRMFPAMNLAIAIVIPISCSIKIVIVIAISTYL